MAARRYWGLQPTAVTANYPGFSELGFATSIGGSTITSGGTPGATSSYPGYGVSRLFDGSAATAWYSNGGGLLGHRVWYDFGSAVEIAETLYTQNESGDYAPISWDIVTSSDGSTWTTAYSVGGAVSGLLASSELGSTWDNQLSSTAKRFPNYTLFTPTTAAHAMWRVRATEVNPGSSSYLGVAAIEFAATAGGANLATGGFALSRGVFSYSSPPKYAFDGNSGTKFYHGGATCSAGNPNWIGYVFSAATAIGAVRITATNDGGGFSPRDFEIQYSDDGLTWTTAASFTDETFSDSQTREFTFSLGTAAFTQVIWFT